MMCKHFSFLLLAFMGSNAYLKRPINWHGLNCSVRGRVSSLSKRFGHHQWLNQLYPSCPIAWLLKAVNSVH